MTPLPEDFQLNSEADFQALFNRYHVEEEMPVEVMDRVLQAVLLEVSVVNADRAAAVALNGGIDTDHADIDHAAHANGVTPSAALTSSAPLHIPHRTQPHARQKGESQSIWQRLVDLVSTPGMAWTGAIAALFLVVVFVSTQPWTSGPVAHAKVAGGSFTLLRQNSNSYITYQEDSEAQIRLGDQILTESGTVTVEFFPGQIATISPNSKVELLEYARQDDSTQVAMRVHRGQTLHDIEDDLTPTDSYRVLTPTSAASVTGTRFVVAVDEAEQTIVATLEGSVNVVTRREVPGNTGVAEEEVTEVSVAAGSQILATRSEAPAVSTFQSIPALSQGQFLFYASRSDEPLVIFSEPSSASPIIT